MTTIEPVRPSMIYNLDQLPRGLVYVAFLALAGLSARGFWRLFRRRRVDSASYSQIGATGLFAALACLIGALAIAHHMFLRFHAVQIKGDRMELLYCWPRPSVSLTRLEFARLEIIRKRRVSRLEIYQPGGEMYPSIFYTRAAADDRVILAINTWKQGPANPAP